MMLLTICVAVPVVAEVDSLLFFMSGGYYSGIIKVTQKTQTGDKCNKAKKYKFLVNSCSTTAAVSGWNVNFRLNFRVVIMHETP